MCLRLRLRTLLDSFWIITQAMTGVFTPEYWAKQKHPADAFCAGDLLKIWFRDLSPKLLDSLDMDAVRFTKPDAGTRATASAGTLLLTHSLAHPLTTWLSRFLLFTLSLTSSVREAWVVVTLPR
jgi:hypothetical protein